MLFGWSFRINGGTSMHMFGRLCNGMELFIIWEKYSQVENDRFYSI